MSQIASSSAVGGAVSGAAANRFSEMKSEDFIKIMITELTNQDPLDPSDSSALLDQIDSIRSIESDMELSRQLASLVTENQLASAGNMIGKFVGGKTENFQFVTGFVVSAIRQEDTIYLELDTGWWVPMENVETVLDPTLFEGGEGDEGEGGSEGEGEGEGEGEEG